MIEVRQLSKRFGTVQAVDGVSFQVGEGEIVALLGPNGAGKTTTLRCLYALARPDAGEARIDGISVQDDPRRALARIGVLPDAKGLYNRLSAWENIAYYGHLHGLPEAQIRQRIQRLAEELGMEDFLHRRCEGFSLGQRMKVAIARALIHQPRHLLLDEPTSGLDVGSVRGLRQLLLDLRARGHSILFSSHVMQEVERLCDRVVMIGRGRIVADGTRDEICHQAGTDDLEEAFVQLTGAET